MAAKTGMAGFARGFASIYAPQMQQKRQVEQAKRLNNLSIFTKQLDQLQRSAKEAPDFLERAGKLATLYEVEDEWSKMKGIMDFDGQWKKQNQFNEKVFEKIRRGETLDREMLAEAFQIYGDKADEYVESITKLGFVEETVAANLAKSQADVGTAEAKRETAETQAGLMRPGGASRRKVEAEATSAESEAEWRNVGGVLVNPKDPNEQIQIYKAPTNVQNWVAQQLDKELLTFDQAKEMSAEISQASDAGDTVDDKLKEVRQLVNVYWSTSMGTPFESLTVAEREPFRLSIKYATEILKADKTLTASEAFTLGIERYQRSAETHVKNVSTRGGIVGSPQQAAEAPVEEKSVGAFGTSKAALRKISGITE